MTTRLRTTLLTVPFVAGLATLTGCATPSQATIDDMAYRCRQAPSILRVENCLNQYRSLGYIPNTPYR
jgi:hypothetical protein